MHVRAVLASSLLPRLFVWVLAICAFAVVAAGQANWEEFKAMCARQGLDAKPNPPQCVERQPRTTTTVDYDAQRRAEEQRQAEEQRRAEEQRQRAAREAAERKAAEEERQRFEADRDKTYQTLKGSVGTRGHSNGGSTDDPPMRGSRIDTGIRTGRPTVVDRDFSGPNSAWKQLFCAASILGPGISKLNLRDEASVPADYEGFKNSALEATNALNGQTRGVPCAAAPDLPKFSSAYDSPGKQVEATQRLITNVVKLADRLESARNAVSSAKSELSKPSAPDTGTPLTNPIAEQRRLNALRDAEKKRIWKVQQQFDKGKVEEKVAKDNLIKIQEDVKKAIDDPESFGVAWDADAPAPPTNTLPPKRHTP